MTQKILGIDIGGSGIKGALVDVTTGQLLSDRHRIPTPKGGQPEDVIAVLNKLLKHFHDPSMPHCPIGITFPGVVHGGCTLTAANMHKDWIGFPAEETFNAQLNQHFYLLNDADAAGLAEAHFGESNKGVVLLLTFGTGIGSALIHNGVLIPNTELGHLWLEGKHAESVAAARVKDDKNLSWKAWTKRVNRYLSHIERLFSPDTIIIGGGVSKHADQWLHHLETRALVQPSQFRNNAGIIGAALYAHQQAKAQELECSL